MEYSFLRSERCMREERLHKLFGINAELLIDHAWSWEPCTIAYIKNYSIEAEQNAAHGT